MVGGYTEDLEKTTELSKSTLAWRWALAQDNTVAIIGQKTLLVFSTDIGSSYVMATSTLI